MSKDILIVFYWNSKLDELVKSPKIPFSSFRRKPESSHFNSFWTPAFAGVTELGLFTKPSKLDELVKSRIHQVLGVKCYVLG